MKAKQIHFDETIFTIHEGGILFSKLSQADNREEFWKHPMAIFEEKTIVKQLDKTILKDFTADIVATIVDIEDIDFQHWYEEFRVIKKPEFTILLKCARHTASVGNFNMYGLHIFKEQY